MKRKKLKLKWFNKIKKDVNGKQIEVVYCSYSFSSQNFNVFVNKDFYFYSSVLKKENSKSQ